MPNIKRLIIEESETLYRLHKNIHVTFGNRDKDIESWHKACAEFHSYESVITSMIDRVYDEKKFSDQELLEFAISFLEVDPMFFRSGYIKEAILKKLKSSILNKSQRDRVINILIDAVRNRGCREFRRYCIVAMVMNNQFLINTLTGILASEPSSTRSRAKMMLGYIGTKDYSRE